MQASARLTVEHVPGGRTRISRLHSDGPLVLRPTHPVTPEPMRRWGLDRPGTARVSLVAGAAGPVGGDRLTLDVDVGSGAVLVLRAVAATLLLPGPHGQPSCAHVTVRVAAGGTLVWLPGRMIAARNCDHRASTDIRLQPGARLLVREELILGRSGEQPGAVRQRLRVTLADEPLHDQELHIGPRAPGWAGPAVTGGRKAVGALLLVEPPPGTCDGARHADTTIPGTAVTPLGGPGMLVTALAPDALALRHRLDSGLVVAARGRN